MPLTPFWPPDFLPGVHLRSFARAALAATACLLSMQASAHAAGVGVASPSTGQLDVVFRHDGGGDGTGYDANADSLVQLTRREQWTVRTGSWQPEAQWDSPVNIGGKIHKDSAIALVAPAPDVLVLGVRWIDNTFRLRTWTKNRGWGDWRNLGGNLQAGPALASLPSTGSNAANERKLVAVYTTLGRVQVGSATWEDVGLVQTRTTLMKYGTLSADGATWTASTAPSTPPTWQQGESGGLWREDAWSAPVAGSNPTKLNASPSAGGCCWEVNVESEATNAAGRNSLATAYPRPNGSGGWVYGAERQQQAPRDIISTAIASVSPAGTITATGGELFANLSAGSVGMYQSRRWQPFPGWGPNVLSTIIEATAARPSESTTPHPVGATWSHRLDSVSGQQLAVVGRSNDGCLRIATKTDPLPLGTWTASQRIPTVPYAATPPSSQPRCSWPGRVGTAPLFKRSDLSDRGPRELAYASWKGSARLAPGPVETWNNSRFQSIGLDQGSDPVTTWAPRNWHKNTWVYRKSTSYSRSENLHTAPATKDYFVRLRGDNHVAAVNYGCSTTPGPKLGCTQALLNVTDPDARSFWLRGADNKVAFLDAGAPAPTNCQGGSVQDGVLDMLACVDGSEGTTNGRLSRANYKGVWLDDLFATLYNGPVSSTYDTVGSFVSDLETGVNVKNGELAARLPFSPSLWTTGIQLLTMELRNGIKELQAKDYTVPWGPRERVLKPTEGIVAANLKWGSFGFAQTATPAPITATSPMGKIIQFLSLVELEHGWIDGQIAPVDTAEWNFDRRLSFVDQVHALGRGVIEEKTASQDVPIVPAAPNCGGVDGDGNIVAQTSERTRAHYVTAQYNLAATLLSFKGPSWTNEGTYSPGDWVGDMCEYYDRGWDGYQTDLGASTTATRPAITTLRARVVTNGVITTRPIHYYRRNYERGFVLVVPPGSDPVTITGLPTTARWRPTGTNALTTISSGSITLREREGAVVLT